MAKRASDKQGLSFEQDTGIEEYVDRLFSKKIKARRAAWCFGVVLAISFVILLVVSKANSGHSMRGNIPLEIIAFISILSVYAVGISCLYSWRLTQKIRGADELKNRKTAEKIIRYYRQVTKRAGMPDYPLNCDCLNIWTANNTLYVVEDEQAHLNRYSSADTTPRAIQIKRIPFNMIQYYDKEGDVQYTSHVSGGGGGGTSISGAIIGGVIAGDLGAIIGSRKKVNPITTETRTYDSRHTVLRYYNDLKALEVLTFTGFRVYDFLLNTIPEKDLTTIQLGGGRQQGRHLKA